MRIYCHRAGISAVGSGLECYCLVAIFHVGTINIDGAMAARFSSSHAKPGWGFRGMNICRSGMNILDLY